LDGLVGGRAAASAAVGEGIVEEMAAARLSFTASAEILIEFASHQEAGGVTLEMGDGAEVTVAVISGANGIDLLVRPGGVRIQNDAGTTADYRVQLPAESQLVRIRIGSDPPIELRTAELLDELYLELGKH
jgi:hypothetical protein